MKIHTLRFRNLNSLVGEWSIDFTDEAFVQSGIFAITGPTGAGKSTILDALCLALYGRTPRLSRISKSGNEIMSRMAGECFAEVTFGIGTGRFTAHWSQRRARCKPDGELQTPKHELAEVPSGKIIDATISGVATKIVEITGMDFDRFTRSMLLAQGGFAAFLDATADQRSPILEQITGTEIYSRISVAVHERLREERDKCDKYSAELAGIDLLSPEDELKLHEELAVTTTNEQGLVKQQKVLGVAIEWLRTMVAISHDLTQNTQRKIVLDREYDAFAAKRSSLRLANNAATLESGFRHLSIVREQLRSDTEKLSQADKRRLDLQEQWETVQVALVQAETTAAAAAKKQEESLPVLRQVRELDLQIVHSNKTLHEQQYERDTAAKEQAKAINDRSTEHNKLAVAVSEHDRVDAYLNEHAGDALLITELAGLKEKIAAFITCENEFKKTSDALAAQKLLVERSKKQSVTQAAALSRLQQNYRIALDAVAQVKCDLDTLLAGKLLREYRAEYEALLREQLYRQKIADLEAERKRLEDGKPCPLCGATDHPFAQGNIPGKDAFDEKITTLSTFIQQAEAMESSLLQSEEKARRDDTAVREQEQVQTRVQSDIGHAERELLRFTDEYATTMQRYEEQKRSLMNDLGTFGITDCTVQSSSAIIADLVKRRDWWQKAEQKRSKIEKNTAVITAAIQRIDGITEILSRSLAEKEKSMQLLERDRAALATSRKTMFGTNDPSEEEQRITATIRTSEATVNTLRNKKNGAEKECASIEATITDLRDRSARQSSEREQLEQSFMAICLDAGFADEAAFLAARLPATERDVIAKRDKELNDARADCATRISDREQTLGREREKNITDRTLDDCTKELQTLDEQTKICHQAIGAINQRLAGNRAAKDRTAAMCRLLETQRRESARWENLHALIGSADGKKYRNFAQGITFELLLSHANTQLQKLTDRYLLTIDPLEPLECFVVDTYQAGEVRSARNLSGGESFIVSMALALGLSSMSSNRVRVDSLFLDEGFGTLDEDTLETALETLAELKQEGKLIGVISHINALHERIGTQIRVIPVSGGKSRLEGPGCRLISTITL